METTTTHKQTNKQILFTRSRKQTKHNDQIKTTSGRLPESQQAVSAGRL